MRFAFLILLEVGVPPQGTCPASYWSQGASHVGPHPDLSWSWFFRAGGWLHDRLRPSVGGCYGFRLLASRHRDCRDPRLPGVRPAIARKVLRGVP